MKILVFAMLALAVLPTRSAEAEPDAQGRALIFCELASNQHMASFAGEEPVGGSESIALLSFCFASKIVDNPSLKRDLLKAGKQAADKARKIDPNFRVTDWPGDK